MPKRKDTVTRARRFRREPTQAEQKMWSLLRGRRLAEFKFRRQHPIGPYAADFACVGARLVVEIDGPSHSDEEQVAFDAKRTAFLETAGWRVLRVPNAFVYERIGVVEGMILEALRS